MLFSPTIGAAIAAGYWFVWVRCPACRTVNAVDLRTLEAWCPSPWNPYTTKDLRRAGSLGLLFVDELFRPFPTCLRPLKH
jgi:hypothetical protein